MSETAEETCKLFSSNLLSDYKTLMFEVSLTVSHNYLQFVSFASLHYLNIMKGST